MTLLFALSLLFQNTISAEESNSNSNSKNNLSKENFEELISDGISHEDITYDEWVKISDESLFDELDNKFPDQSNNKFNLLSSSSSKASFSLKRGDILVSNGTASLGLTGHAGIALNSNSILHISGPGKNPVVITAKTWASKYGLIKGQKDGRTRTQVFRIKSSDKAGAAALWANDVYKGKKYRYGTGGKLTSKDPTYCSKIIWQAYNYVGVVNKPSAVIVMPYKLPDYFKSSAGVSKVGTL